MSWQYTDSSNAVVFRTDPGGAVTSQSVTSSEIQAWIAAGNAIDPAPPPSAAQAAETARVNSYLVSADRIDLVSRLRTATPAQVDAWVDNNVTTIAAARTLFKAIIKSIALDARG